MDRPIKLIKKVQVLCYDNSMRIEEIIKQNQGGIVLFLGRITNFTPDELSNFLEAQGMSYSDKYVGQKVALTVLSTMMTPLEEEVSYELYDAKIPEVRLSQFEEFYTKHIKPNTLMMSIKLSNDQERLKRLLKNEAFSDEVYLKLFKMYDWGDDGVYDSDDNRDVTITFVKRYFNPDGFKDPAMVYSPITLSNIARDIQSTEVLDAMLTMPNHEIKQSRKDDVRPKNLREIIALNPYISNEIIRYLLSFNSERINGFLACNNSIDNKTQEYIFKNSNLLSKRMLTQNENLDDSIFKELLKESSEIVESLLTFQKLTDSRLNMVLDAGLNSEILAFMGENKSIKGVTSKLLELDNRLVDFKLASNINLTTKELNGLYKKYGDDIKEQLILNQNLSISLLERFYNDKDDSILYLLAKNPTTPKYILDELCSMNIHEINRGLAVNPSVSLEYLQQFALDSELIMLMSTNERYLDSVNSAHLGMRSDDRY